MRLYSVKDLAVEKFGPVFQMETHNAAVRAFKRSIENNPFRSDLELYFLGSFDEESGIIDKFLELIYSERDITAEKQEVKINESTV